jgi:hypothetical protein
VKVGAVTSWACPECGSQNSSAAFCESCGAASPAASPADVTAPTQPIPPAEADGWIDRLGAAHPTPSDAVHPAPDHLRAPDRLGAAHPEPDRLSAANAWADTDRLSAANAWAEPDRLSAANAWADTDRLSGADRLGRPGEDPAGVPTLRPAVQGPPAPEEILVDGGERPPDLLPPGVPTTQRRPKVVAAAAAVAVVSVLAVATYLVVSNGRGSPGAAGNPSTAIPETTAETTAETTTETTAETTTETTADSPSPSPPEPSPSETAAGIVVISPSVGDSRATDVATMFNTYFSGINSRDYQVAASVFDPSGPINPNDPAEVSTMAKGLATTTDSEVLLREVADATDGTVRAVVTFRSSQAPGYGPKGHEQETCTQWSIVYSLRQTANGYLILRTKGTSSRC